MLNIYDFFNSPDVAEYCKSINHTLNAVESAVMINQSCTRTFAEKHTAYKTIIAEYPDMELPKGNNHEYFKSFHKILGKFIEHEEILLKSFLSFNQYEVYKTTINGDEIGLFTNYEKALDNALKYVKEYTAYGEDIKNITIKKIYLDSKNKVYITATLSLSGEIMKLHQHGVMTMKDSDELDYLFESIYIDIPVPFKRGDLVEISSDRYVVCGKPESEYDVYVLQDICRNNSERNFKMLYVSDLMDMTADVFYERDGVVQCECMHFYPDLQYCRRELDGETRILKYISHYLKNEICLCTLLKTQKIISADKMREKAEFNPILDGICDFESAMTRIDDTKILTRGAEIEEWKKIREQF